MQKQQRLCQANWDQRGYLCLWPALGANISLIESALNSLEVQVANTQKIYLKLPEANGENYIETETDCLCIETVEAINLLTLDWKNLSSSLEVADTFLFWREASKLLLELLAKGKFLPSLQRKNLSWHSSWKPLIEENEKFKTLAHAMPLVCQHTNHRKIQAEDLLYDFISNSTDKLVRSFIGGRLFLEIPEIEELTRDKEAAAFWLKSIFSRDSSLNEDSKYLPNLENNLSKWSSKFTTNNVVEFKLGFRILEPHDDNLPWHLSYFLFSDKQEIEAEDIWSGNKDVEINFLRELGKAIKIFPKLRESLATACPKAMKLTIAEAYFFMKDLVPLLTSNGFKILLPDWWNSTEEYLNLTLNITSSSDLGYSNSLDRPLSSMELLNFDWNVAVGETALSMQQVEQLAKGDIPLTRIDGKWVKLNQEKLQETINFVEKQSNKNAYSVIDAIRLGLGLEDENLPNINITGTGWFEKLIESDATTLDQLTPSKDLKTTLRPYQIQGLTWMSFLTGLNIGACLADDMGLGKTIQFIALLLHEKELSRKEILPNLLVVPMSVLPNWEDEILKFAPNLKIYTHHGARSSSLEELKYKSKNVDLVITTYSIMQRDEKLLSEIEWKRIALDEAQNIKNVEAKQTKAAKRLSRVNPLCHRMALTGTPLENHLQELWSIFDFLNPGLLGTVNEFRKRYSIPIEKNQNERARKALVSLLRPFILRREKSDPKVISELPEKIEIQSYSTLTDEQASLYQSVLDQMLYEINNSEGIHRKGLVLATITKLKQICNHPSLFLKDNRPLANRSGKLTQLEELLEVILAEKDRVLIFTQFAQMGELLKNYFSDLFKQEVLFLHGSLTSEARKALIAKFRKLDGPQIFILSLRAGGQGLNLTEANQVVHYDQWWNPAVMDQATDRAHRIGQTRGVQVRKLICKGTLEEKIDALIAKKKFLANEIVSSTKNDITAMSVDELRKLLSIESIGEL